VYYSKKGSIGIHVLLIQVASKFPTTPPQKKVYKKKIYFMLKITITWYAMWTLSLVYGYGGATYVLLNTHQPILTYASVPRFFFHQRFYIIESIIRYYK
jgi:hypothetical protein